MECEVVSLVRFRHISPVQKMIVIYNSAAKIRLTQNRNMLLIILVLHLIDESIAEAGFSDPVYSFFFLSTRQPNDTDVEGSTVWFLGHTYIDDRAPRPTCPQTVLSIFHMNCQSHT